MWKREPEGKGIEAVKRITTSYTGGRGRLVFVNGWYLSLDALIVFPRQALYNSRLIPFQSILGCREPWVNVDSHVLLCSLLSRIGRKRDQSWANETIRYVLGTPTAWS